MKTLLKSVLMAGLAYAALPAFANVEVFKSINNNLTEVDSGEVFTYKLQYRAASTTTDFFNATLTDPLPAGLEFVSLNGTVHVDSFNYNPAGNELTIQFVDPLPAGSTGDIEVNVRFKPGVTEDGTVAVNTATIDCGLLPPHDLGSGDHHRPGLQYGHRS